MALIYLLAMVGVLCGFVEISQQTPADRFNREKEFLDAFGEWLQTAQEAKNINERDDPGAFMPYVDNVVKPQDEWKGIALKQQSQERNFNGEWFVRADWPEKKDDLGQIGGVATDDKGNAIVFHRADREWTEDSFDEKNVFAKKEEGPIKEPTIVTLNRTDGAKLDGSWGENRFYLPHGLTVDQEGNHWVTDVALHQVFKFGKDKTKPELVLGHEFEPATDNDDRERFCKPTDVAVASNGDFFVADGYCNSRIIKYSPSGEIIAIFGVDDMWIPHSLALVEDLDLICVADREDDRILCYKAGLHAPDTLGDPEVAYLDEDIMGRVFAITYSPMDGLLYAVTAKSGDLPGSGFTIDMRAKDNNQDIIALWEPSEEGFIVPHDLEVSPDGKTLYVGEIGKNQVWKFGEQE